MVSVALALMLGLFASMVAASAQAAFRQQQAQQEVEESGRFALNSVARQIRMAGYREFGALHGGAAGPVLSGVASDLVPATRASSSDVLLLSEQGTADASVRNCAGFAVADNALAVQSIWYVAASPGGSRELRCRYRGASGWGDDAIVRGVDAFALRFGIDLDAEPDGLVDQYWSAAAVELLPDGWQRVRSVRLGLLLHAAGARPEPREPRQYAVFPELAGDMLVIDEASMAPALRTLPRRLFGLTVALRNGGG